MKKIIAIVLCLILTLSLNVVMQTTVEAGVYWAEEAEYIQIGDTVNYSRATYDGYINPYYFDVLEKTDLSIKMYIKQFDVNFSVYLYNDDGDCLFGEYGISEGTCKYNHSSGTYNLDLNFGKLKEGTYYLEFSNFNRNYENRGAFVLYKNKPISVPSDNKSTSSKKVKKFKVSKKSIVVKKGKSKSVTVTFKYKSGSVEYKIKKKKIVSAKWGTWHGDKIKLKIKGKKKGKTTVYITNSKTSKKIKINVKVV